MMLKNYTFLTLINAGQYELDRYREYARRTAYEEMRGSMALTKVLYGPWFPNEFVVVPPGELNLLEGV